MNNLISILAFLFGMFIGIEFFEPKQEIVEVEKIIEVEKEVIKEVGVSQSEFDSCQRQKLYLAEGLMISGEVLGSIDYYIMYPDDIYPHIDRINELTRLIEQEEAKTF